MRVREDAAIASVEMGLTGWMTYWEWLTEVV